MAIPKKIHLIWLGGSLPDKFHNLADRIKSINFDYEIKEWNDTNINFELINQNLFDQTENLGAKSDILRFELLYKYGGIYMDYDFLQIKKFDDLLIHDFFAGADENDPNGIWNSIVGSSQENEICKKFLDGLLNVTPIKKHEINRIMNETGPFYLTKLVNNNNWTCNMKILIGKYFFPFPGGERRKIRNLTSEDLEYAKSFANEDTYSIHLHTTAWQ